MFGKTLSYKLFGFLLATILAASPFTANATNINFTAIRNGFRFCSIGLDASTGQFYVYNGIGGPSGTQTFNVYSSASALAANTRSSTVTLSSNFLGAYLVAKNGTLYGRANSSTASNVMGIWNLSTGAQTNTAIMTGVGGQDF